MREIEITQAPDLSPEEVIRCEMHSFTNLINSIYYELQLLASKLETPGVLEGEMDLCQKITESFFERERALESVNQAAAFGQQVIEAASKAIKASGRGDLDHHLESLKSMVEVAGVRVRELLARFEIPGDWLPIGTDYIRDGLFQVLEAIALNAQGRFGFAFDDQGSKNKYGFSFKASGQREGKVCLPPIFVDCIRDLVSNSRKYTPSGGSISAEVIQDSSGIELIISDNGVGIPADELTEVVNFGTRGSNVIEKATRGGGFGVTKAWYATKLHHGRIWIASELGKGTRIRIRLPRPVGINCA